MASKLDLVNAALRRLSNCSLLTQEDLDSADSSNSDTPGLVVSTFDKILQSILIAHPWSWTIFWRKLDPSSTGYQDRGTSHDGRYQYAHLLPDIITEPPGGAHSGEVLKRLRGAAKIVCSLEREGPPLYGEEWHLTDGGQRIAANLKTIWVMAQYGYWWAARDPVQPGDPDEGWQLEKSVQDSIEDAVSVKLAAEWSYSLTDDSDLYGRLRKQAMDMLQDARTSDSQSRPPPVIEASPCVDVRFGID